MNSSHQIAKMMNFLLYVFWHNEKQSVEGKERKEEKHWHVQGPSLGPRDAVGATQAALSLQNFLAHPGV